MLLFLVVLPILLISWQITIRLEKTTETQVGHTLLQLVKTSHLTLDRVIKNVDEATERLIASETIQQIPSMSEISELDRLKKFLVFDTQMLKYSNMSLNFSIFIIDDKREYKFAAGTTIQSKGVFYIKSPNRADWFDEAVIAKGKGLLRIIKNHNSDKNTVAYIRSVTSKENNEECMGVLVVTGLENMMIEDLAPIELPQNGMMALVNASNELLSSEQSNIIGEDVHLPEDVSLLAEGVHIENMDGVRWLFAIHHSMEFNTKLFVKTPVTSILEDHIVVKRIVDVLIIAYFVIIMIIFVYFFNTVLKPLGLLAQLFRSYEPGAPVSSKLSKAKRQDEIGELGTHFYEMTRRLNQTISEKYLLELKQKEAELTILHGQINPHLLYNTLESIYWTSKMEGATESSEMIRDMSLLMRIGLSRGKNVITLEEELNHCKAYLRLQLNRYYYSFQVLWEVEEETGSYLIPKISLQPLVENAILHGIKNMENEGKLTIEIRMKKSDESGVDILFISIHDNGYKPVSLEKIQQILDGKTSGEGYGIKNVHKRIALHFGPEYGLFYSINTEGGTTATIVLPAVIDESNQDTK
ncbi:sensor histidine kinase [Paenibacillus sp. N1-5-1-14]|uniref:sensor histidine kinase n=1 Tax=Paenibacillus radicibacter TaxID=2972488 RepID=UPI002158E6A9|nr:sensor histidine kinase [Paenibacillus radicibacter]MCR8642541.1 sensor histidine kinase [Paenibacillus radicibacter]